MTSRARFLPLFLVLPAFAQSDNEHGVSAGPAQIAYLVKPVEVAVPPGVASRGGAPLDEDMGVLMAIGNDARAIACPNQQLRLPSRLLTLHDGKPCSDPISVCWRTAHYRVACD